MQKENKGITLVALVITIAIMLILAGITISVSLKGGLFNKANESKTQMQIEIEKEQLLTAALGTLGRNGKVNLNELDNNLPEGFTGSNGEYTSSTGNRYQVTEDANIILLDGTEEEPDIPVTPPVSQETEIAGTWVFNDIIELRNEWPIYFYLEFESGGDEWTELYFGSLNGVDDEITSMWYGCDMDSTIPYSTENVDSKWVSYADYKTITISTTLAEMENGEEFLAWLNANAVKQSD